MYENLGSGSRNEKELLKMGRRKYPVKPMMLLPHTTPFT